MRPPSVQTVCDLNSKSVLIAIPTLIKIPVWDRKGRVLK